MAASAVNFQARKPTSNISADEQSIRAEFKVPVMMYAIDFETAKGFGWKHYGIRPQGPNGEFLMDYSFLGEEHEFVRVSTIHPHLEALLSVDQKTLQTDRIMARADSGHSIFANAWAQRNLTESEEALGPQATAMKEKNAVITPETLPSDASDDNKA